MSRLTPEGQLALADICHRHGVAEHTSLVLLDELARNNGTMAQFNLPELGGSGQWMAGGMTMVGDMFNHGLKARVDGLCQELAGLLATAPFRPAPRPVYGAGSVGGVTVSTGVGSAAAGQWWPPGLGWPDWQGSQNAMRYAFFSGANRLALDIGGSVSVYDTSGFTLTGVGQQQSSGSGSSLTFTGPGGLVTLDRLRRVDTPAPVPPPEPAARAEPEPERAPAAPADKAATTPPASAPPSSPVGQAAAVDGLTGAPWAYQAPDGAAPIRITFAADGVLHGTETPALQYWELVDGVLTLFADDGRATARFDDVTGASAGTALTGTSPPGSGAAVTLRRPESAAPTAKAATEPSGTVLTLSCDLTGGTWRLAEDGGQDIATLSLHADGTLTGQTRPTEAGWRLDATHLLLLHKSGRPTARFTSVTVEDGRWTLRGESLANAAAVYVLRQV